MNKISVDTFWYLTKLLDAYDIGAISCLSKYFNQLVHKYLLKKYKHKWEFFIKDIVHYFDLENENIGYMYWEPDFLTVIKFREEIISQRDSLQINHNPMISKFFKTKIILFYGVFEKLLPKDLQHECCCLSYNTLYHGCGCGDRFCHRPCGPCGGCFNCRSRHIDICDICESKSHHKNNFWINISDSEDDFHDDYVYDYFYGEQEQLYYEEEAICWLEKNVKL